jgi:hypothetical protein
MFKASMLCRSAVSRISAKTFSQADSKCLSSLCRRSGAPLISNCRQFISVTSTSDAPAAVDTATQLLSVDGATPDLTQLLSVGGAASDLTQQVVTAAAEPTFRSLGLAHFYPSGWLQALMEQIHVQVDLPWWATIMLSKLRTRLTIISPIF